MTLLELCEPLFQRVCLLNRMARTDVAVAAATDFSALRAEILGVFDGIRKQAAVDGGLSRQWEKLELPLIFFVDSVIAESRLPVASQWHRNRLAYDRKELAGDEKFFDLLDETLADPSDDASGRLAIYYVCMGLGFSGWYAGQPEYLRKKMLEIAHRIDKSMETNPAVRLCPEAYDGVDTRNLVQPPATRIAGIAVIFVGLCLIFLAVDVFLYRQASVALTDSLSAIISQENPEGRK